MDFKALIVKSSHGGRYGISYDDKYEKDFWHVIQKSYFLKIGGQLN